MSRYPDDRREDNYEERRDSRGYYVDDRDRGGYDDRDHGYQDRNNQRDYDRGYQGGRDQDRGYNQENRDNDYDRDYDRGNRGDYRDQRRDNQNQGYQNRGYDSQGSTYSRSDRSDRDEYRGQGRRDDRDPREYDSRYRNERSDYSQSRSDNYSQRGSRGSGRGFASSGRGTGSGSCGSYHVGARSTTSSGSSGGQSTKIPSIAKADLPHNAQVIAKRPDMKVEDMEKVGHKSEVEANYIVARVPTSSSIKLFQYDVEILTMGRGGPKKLTKREQCAPKFWKLVQQHEQIFPFFTKMVYNDVNLLWSLERLKFPQDVGDYTFDIKGGRDDRVTEQIRFRFAKLIDFSVDNEENKLSFTAIFDALLTMRVRAGVSGDAKYFVAHGNGMYVQSRDARAGQYMKNLTMALGMGLDAWTGLHTAFKPHCEHGMLINVDISHSVFYKQEFSLAHLLIEIDCGYPLTEEKFESMASIYEPMTMSVYQTRKLADMLKGTTLSVSYLPTGKKTFKCAGVTTRGANQIFFTNEHGQRLSVAEYFLHQHGIRLRFPNMPCVEKKAIRGGAKPSFPLELVFTWDQVQKWKGRIPDAQLAKMIRETAFKPELRKRIICDLAIDTVSENPERRIPAIISNDDDWMRQFQVTVDTNFVSTKATFLPVPQLVFKNDEHVDENRFGVWELRKSEGRELRKAHNKKQIVGGVIYIQNPRQQCKSAESLEFDFRKFGFLMETLYEFGMEIPYGKEPKMRETFHQREESIDKFRNGIKTWKTNMLAKHPNASPLVLLVFENRCTTMRNYNREIYSDYALFKQICDVEIGVYCQGILKKNYDALVGDPLTCATAHNVALKIMAKIGAVHYRLGAGQVENWDKLTNPEEPTLLLGIDVTHPGVQDRAAGHLAACSVASVVGNVDLECAVFDTSYRVQDAGQERIVHMNDEVRARLTAFQEKTGKKPAHIVVYRDGVSETEFQKVLYEEKRSIEDACKSLDPEMKYTLTYIVTSKRHHTRFFPIKQSDQEGEAGNVKPGLLVESGITSNKYFDFYLTSHFGPLGTSRPTHYYVLWDDWNPSPDFWQTISHALCYSYVRCPKSISLPAPVMYAHLAAKRAKDYLDGFSVVNEDFVYDDKNLSSHQQLEKALRHDCNLEGMLFC